jgi:SAM-dependent methyltransferase
MKPFDYSHFEAQFMNREYIQMLRQPQIRYFKDCKKVMDLACGPGFFLELLNQAGIEAVGVDRNETLVEKIRQKQLKAVHSDVFRYLDTVEERYEGIFCSHLLEHLPFAEVVRLIEKIVLRLLPEGTLVFVLPNPGSIRLHLFGFWRDPEHVRFYNGSLIASVCQHYGLKLEYSNEEETPNQLKTPRLEPISFPTDKPGWKGSLCGRKRERELLSQEFNKRVESFNQEMERFSDALNKIWSRDDEVFLVLRKPS